MLITKIFLPKPSKIYSFKHVFKNDQNTYVINFVSLTDNMIVCHLPYGPTACFNLSNVVMRHDIPDVGKMSEAYPHLIFNKLTSKLGNRVSHIPPKIQIASCFFFLFFTVTFMLYPVLKTRSRLADFSGDFFYISLTLTIYAQRFR